MILYGASGHAKVIIDIIHNLNSKVSFLFDDNPKIKEFFNHSVRNNYDTQINKNEELIISIGDNKIRKKIAGKVNHTFGKIISPFAIVSNYSKIDYGSVIMHGSIVQAHSVVGKHVIINTNASVDHDCTIEDFSHISPGVSLAGNVHIGEGTQIGIGACVLQNIKIGKWCVIGAGSVIINNIPDYSVVVGNPGKIIKSLENEK